MSSSAAGIRARNRADLTTAILESARTQLADDGAAGLSLRAIARELGMASSAIYRYFPSRDHLLTQLIIDAYNSLADYVEARERAAPRADRCARFRAIGKGIRTWALAHEHEYALIYGSPVPGYQAPQDTIAPASRVAALFVALIAEAVAAGVDAAAWPPVPPKVRRSIAPARPFFDASGTSIPDELVIRGLMAWSFVYGTVSFELFGHFHNVVTPELHPTNPFFDAALDRVLELVPLG